MTKKWFIILTNPDSLVKKTALKIIENAGQKSGISHFGLRKILQKRFGYYFGMLTFIDASFPGLILKPQDVLGVSINGIVWPIKKQDISPDTDKLNKENQQYRLF